MHSYTEPENENEGETNDEKVVDRHYKRSNSVRSAGRLWRPDSTDRRPCVYSGKGHAENWHHAVSADELL